jgi:hypothetical protein
MSEKRGGTPLTPEEWHDKMRKKREKLEKPLPKETLTPEGWKEKVRNEREKAGVGLQVPAAGETLVACGIWRSDRSSSSLAGGPMCFPSLRARATPAFVRSLRFSRSRSATHEKIANIRFLMERSVICVHASLGESDQTITPHFSSSPRTHKDGTMTNFSTVSKRRSVKRFAYC